MNQQHLVQIQQVAHKPATQPIPPPLFQVQVITNPIPKPVIKNQKAELVIEFKEIANILTSFYSFG